MRPPKRRKGRRYLIAVRTVSHLVNRDFSATEPNQLWVSDIMEHLTKKGHVFDNCLPNRTPIIWQSPRALSSISLTFAPTVALMESSGRNTHGQDRSWV